MKDLSRTLTLLSCLFFAGCASLPAGNADVLPPQSQYDAIIADSSGSLLTVNQLAEALAPADVVVIGEYHGHHGAHLLEALIQSTLYRKRPQQVLSMEQFTLTDQPELDRYLSGETGEEELIADTGAWSNYKASYRPLIEFSRRNNVPVIAANAPAKIVRCIGREGEAYLEQLDSDLLKQLPEDRFLDTPVYRDKFFAALEDNHGADEGEDKNSSRIENSYKAQLLRDNTMADQVVTALRENPGHQVIHLNGTFHSENRLGMVAVLEKRRPELEVAVVSPVFWGPEDDFNSLLEEHRDRGDFLYFLQPLPEKYKDSDRQHEAIMQQFHNAGSLVCD
ncbi:ChaN family lipoprotein [Marinobacter sp.]|uniref:ChaN family lipoprotein n=1 Tax=Marinobacter sp. TaxID=50741 RepID=UPI002B4617C4|nr:ChaN family lipoprotein [Marinobacter sp.]HKK57129.1 ChaN family lipoprotein [Marinobacter sp.]